MKIGFAITAYDKFEEAKILFEIIRKEFREYYPISFCSNHPDAKRFAEREKPEIFTQGVNYLIPDGDVKIPSPKRTSIVMRSTDTVQKSCIGALKLDVDYIIHMHADAWVLSEEKLIELIKELEKRKKKFAVRGLGFSWMGIDTPLGHIDDHFFIFHKDFVIQKNFFDFNVEEFWPHKLSIHGILGTNLIAKIGLSNIWYYKKVKGLEYWDGEKKTVPNNYAKPSMYDPQYKMLHVHRGSFPQKYGKKVQAMYLKEANFSKSDFIKQFIKENWIPKNILIKELKEKEKKLNSALKKRLYFLNHSDCRDFTEKEKTLKEYDFKKSIGWLLKFLIKVILRRKQYILTKKTNLGNKKYDFLLEPIIFPEKISKFYSSFLNMNEITKKNGGWLNELEKDEEQAL